MSNLAKTFRYISVLGALALSATVALAEQGPVYVVDMQRVVRDSVAGRAARNDLEVEAKKLEAGMQASQREVGKLAADLKNKAALLSAGALEEKRSVVLGKERALSRKIKDNQEELKRTTHRKLGRIVEEVDRIITDLAEDERYPFIIERDPRVVLFAKEKYDLTNKIIELLDQKKLQL